MKLHKYEELIKNNKRWVCERLEVEPDYFKNLAKGQAPPFLFIGCSDSRMPLTKFTQTEPGELFVHRNIANQVSLCDMNALSVIQYAIDMLQVKHIIVCGHSNCGGVMAAYKGDTTGLVGNWVSPIRDIYLENKEDIDALATEHLRIDQLSRYNVREQVKNLCKTSSMQKAHANGKQPKIHGWHLDIKSGLIEDVKLPLSQWRSEGLAV